MIGLGLVIVASFTVISCAKPPIEHSLAKITQRSGEYGVINRKTGDVAIPFGEYNKIWKFISNGLALVKRDSLYDYIDKIGKIVVPIRFDNAWNFSKNGYAVVKIGNKEGYIDNTSNVVISAKYDDARNFNSSGQAKVELNGKRFYIDKSGNRIR